MAGEQQDALRLDAVLALARWQQTRKGYEGDAELIRTGLALLEPDAEGSYGSGSELLRVEAAVNVSWQRLVTEVMQFAVFLVTKAKRDDELRPEQTMNGLRLLQLSLAAFAANDRRESAVSLSINSCNLLLQALAAALVELDSSNALSTLREVKYIFCYLFGLPAQVKADTTASFQMYRPPTNVFADFMNRALSALFRAVSMLRVSGNDAGDMNECVSLAFAIVCVYQELQRSQMNKRKVFLAVAKTSLRDLIFYRHEIAAWVQQNTAGAKEVLDRLDQTIVDALFDSEHIREFDGALVQSAIWHSEGVQNGGEADTPSKAKKRRQGERGNGKAATLISYQKQLFDELSAILVDSDVSVELKMSVGDFMSVLMRGYSTRIRAAANTKIVDAKSDPKSSRKRAAIVIAATSTTYSPFKFWSELCAVSYTAFKKNSFSEKDHSFDAASIVISLYDALFAALCEYDVYRVTEDTEDQAQFGVMERVLTLFADLECFLLSDESSTSVPRDLWPSITAKRCRIVSRALECSPNIAECCITKILNMLGLQTQLLQQHQSKGSQLKAECQAMVDLMQAYDSMRLLDNLLRATFAVRQGSRGLYTLLAQPVCESHLRRSFVALPPGQVEVLWNLFADEFARFSDGTSGESKGDIQLAVVRFIFQTFVQELHVTPQNRGKIVPLVASTLEKLVDSVAETLKTKGASRLAFSHYQREALGMLGELLVFVNATKSTTVIIDLFEKFFAILDDRGFVSVAKELLQSKKHKHSSKQNGDGPKTADDGLSRSGVIKICVRWLHIKRCGESSGEFRESREKITRIVVNYIIQAKCWDAIAFHLPELMEDALPSDAESCYRELVREYISQSNDGMSTSTERILFDAALYEIARIRSVAPAALATIANQFVQQWQVEASDAFEKELATFFSYLRAIPCGYLEVSKCGDLLVNILTLFKLVTQSSKASGPVRSRLIEWLRLHFQLIATAVYSSDTSTQQSIQGGVRYLILDGGLDTSEHHVVAEVLNFFMTKCGRETTIAGELLSVPLAEGDVGVERSVVLVEALAKVHKNDPALEPTKEEADIVQNAAAILSKNYEQGKLANEVASLNLMRVLLRYHAATSMSQLPVKSNNDGGLFKFLPEALASSMSLVVSKSPVDPCIRSAAWAFFRTVCDQYPHLRSATGDLKSFGCLLAVALAAATDSDTLNEPELPLIDLHRNANKDEFRLLVSTISKECGAPELSRKLSGLIALSHVLDADRKPSSARRQCLTDFKDQILSLLVQNVGYVRTQNEASDAKLTVEVTLHNLRALKLLFCKAELFSWKAHELTQAFVAFEPLQSLATEWRATSRLPYSVDQLHDVWTLSYALLLRIVRHHFASVVNGIPHIVQVTNTLLQVLVQASNSQTEDNSELHWMEWSSNLARLFGYMKEHDTQLRKHVVYLMMAFLTAVTRDKLTPALQHKLRPGVFALLDMCSTFEKEQLYASLDSAGKTLLKTLDMSYRLTYRYAGKV